MLNSPDKATANQAQEKDRLSQLPAKVEAHPIANFSQYTLDRLRVVNYLWSYQNSELTRTRHDLVDMNDPVALQKHVESIFKNEDAFYTNQDFNKRPPFKNGKPTHSMSVPINFDPEVIKNGIEWYDQLKGSFNQIVHKLGNGSGAYSKVSFLMETLEERLMNLAYSKNPSYPSNYLDQNVLVDYILGVDKKHLSYILS